MSCNGCRVLRKGCSESCTLRHCLQWIASPESQGHATVFVAKFFGRAGLMSFISAVPHSHRPALFQSLLFEACGRTVNPVNGAVGLLWTGKWSVCQAAVETVLRGGALRPMPELLASTDIWSLKDPIHSSSNSPPKASPKRKREMEDVKLKPEDLHLSLISNLPVKTEIRRPETPSMNSEESETTTTCFDSGLADQRKLLNLFV